MLYGWKQNSMLTNCFAEYAHLTNVSQTERDIGRKSSFFHTPLHLTPPLRRFPSEYCHDVWYRKTKMVWLPDGEKHFEDIFIRFDRMYERDRRTDGHRMTRFSTNISLYLRNDTRHGHNYNGRRIGT